MNLQLRRSFISLHIVNVALLMLLIGVWAVSWRPHATTSLPTTQHDLNGLPSDARFAISRIMSREGKNRYAPSVASGFQWLQQAKLTASDGALCVCLCQSSLSSDYHEMTNAQDY